jgi:hypothetical protein
MRLMFPRLAVAVAAAAVAAGLSAAQDRTPGQPGAKGGGHDQSYEQCAKACNDCEQICAACSTHCAELVAQGRKEHLRTLRTCQDCATTCAAAAKIVAAKGPFADLICTACADACKRCGDECDKFKDDPMMKRCADECRRCEKACRDMLAHVGKGGAGERK